MNKILLLYFGLLTVCLGCNRSSKLKTNKVVDYLKEDIESKLSHIVLEEDDKGQVFLFSRPKENDFLEYKITYIGKLYSKNYGLIKLLSFVTLSGTEKDLIRQNQVLDLYDESNKIIGGYYLGNNYYEPFIIRNDSLIISNYNTTCNLPTSISFHDSIPSFVFIHCTNNGGDIYNFSKN